MAHAPLDLVLKHIRRLAGDGNATDRQLLHRFATEHDPTQLDIDQGSLCLQEPSQDGHAASLPGGSGASRRANLWTSSGLIL